MGVATPGVAVEGVVWGTVSEGEAEAVARRGEGGGLDRASRLVTGPARRGEVGVARSLLDAVLDDADAEASRGVGGPRSRSSR